MDGGDSLKSGSKSLSTASSRPGAPLARGMSTADGTVRQTSTWERRPEFSYLGELLPCLGEISQPGRAKPNPILFDVTFLGTSSLTFFFF